MKNYALFGLGSLAALSMVACSIGDTDEGEKNEVSNYEFLPVCSTNKNLAGVSYIGQKFYVEEEDAYYLCKETGWELTKSADVETPIVVDSNTVMGSAFVGGFFEVGSPVTLREVKLDTKKNELVETSVSFDDEISSADGRFVISNVSLHSDYALVEVSGHYMDMKTGELSEDSLKLRTLVDMADTDEVKVNLFSEMELPRVKRLVKNGYSVKAAKAQAEHELLTALGFGGSVEDTEGAMIATAILFRNLGDEGDLRQAIAKFAEDFAEKGTWSDEETKTAFADFAFNLENLKIRDDETEVVVLRTSDYRKHLEANGMAKIPGFESYLTMFWNSEYGLGGCGDAREFVVVKNQNAQSDSTDSYYICKSKSWIVATDFERDTVGLGAALDGSIMEGNVDPEKIYVYDSTGTGSGKPARWLPVESAMWDEGREDGQKADSLVLKKWIGHACTDFEDVRYTVAMTINDSEDSLYWGCNNRQWISTDAYVHAVGTLCHAGIYDFNKVETIKVGDNTRYLHCDSTISADKKDTTWTWLQSLTKYDASEGICDDEHTDNIGKVIRYKNKDDDYEYARCVYSGTGKNFAWVEHFSEVDYVTQDFETCDPEAVVSSGRAAYVCKEAVLMNKDTLYFNWRKASDAELATGSICSEKNLGTVETDGNRTEPKYYRCEYLAGNTLWMAATDVDYNTRDSKCDFKAIASANKESYVCTDSTVVTNSDGDALYSKYTWAKATAGEVKAGKPCNKNTVGSTVKVDAKDYKCAVSYMDLNTMDYALATSTDEYEYYSEYLLKWYLISDSKTELQ